MSFKIKNSISHRTLSENCNKTFENNLWNRNFKKYNSEKIQVHKAWPESNRASEKEAPKLLTTIFITINNEIIFLEIK